MPLTPLHKYRSVYENNRLFRKPPLLGPPLSCAKVSLFTWNPSPLRSSKFSFEYLSTANIYTCTPII